MKVLVDVDDWQFQERLNKVWEEGFDHACAFYDRAINQMHRTLHPDQSLSYLKCFESPCKDL